MLSTMQTADVEPKVKITSLRPPRKPELEKIRDEVLAESKNLSNEEVFNQLKDQVRNIHAAYLFTPNGVEVLADLCKVISSTPVSFYYASWKNLAGILNLSFHQIGCIEQIKSDPTEIVLKTYAQHWDATLDTIVSALQSLKRYDALSVIQKGFQELERVARQEQIKRTENITSEIDSIIHGKGTSDGILRPEHLSVLAYQLPITLKLFPTIDKEKKEILVKDNEILKNEGQLQNKSIVTKKKGKKFSKAVMLTFAADGEEIARKIAAQFRKQRGRHLPIGVLILEQHIDKVLQNPEEYITHIFPQMSYIVPILTEGYLLALKGNSHHEGSSLSSIDSMYVKFIHDLMMKYYVQNNCKNDKFRCIIPDGHYLNIINHKHMELDPVLKVYVKESEVEQLACRMLKISCVVDKFNRGA
ncbi:uncharacterized protein [Halyomorpha halys]|uniref:uncharacterized protein n=1 Tax=Halyomorpha halys TaxID=286706 RepID=UPI0006D524AF|nr:uncharacterized protein LOC106678431 [Halyomorpha halys]